MVAAAAAAGGRFGYELSLRIQGLVKVKPKPCKRVFAAACRAGHHGRLASHPVRDTLKFTPSASSNRHCFDSLRVEGLSSSFTAAAHGDVVEVCT